MAEKKEQRQDAPGRSKTEVQKRSTKPRTTPFRPVIHPAGRWGAAPPSGRRTGPSDAEPRDAPSRPRRGLDPARGVHRVGIVATITETTTAELNTSRPSIDLDVGGNDFLLRGKFADWESGLAFGPDLDRVSVRLAIDATSGVTERPICSASTAATSSPSEIRAIARLERSQARAAPGQASSSSRARRVTRR